MPQVRPGYLLIRTACTLVSVGTEKMLVDFGRGNLLQKAIQQPDKVRQVLEKVRTDGIATTIDAVRSKLNQPMALGYCNVGKVIAIGDDVTEFSVGHRVVSNGKHAEVVLVPKNLCACVSDDVEDESAVFTVISAIGLQGIRLLAPTLGETVMVTGLGLVGLLAIQLLRASGCRVIGSDFDSRKCELARMFGAETVDLSKGEDPVSVAMTFTQGRGVDGVLIAATTSSNEPINQAARMCRQRGRVVLIGVVGMEISRAEFYEKEISFQVSCSYGPGRYDQNYEERGQDYPIGFVRWTEQRNFEAVLNLLSTRALNTQSLISHRFHVEQGKMAYDVLKAGNALGIVLDFRLQDARSEENVRSRDVKISLPTRSGSKVKVGFIGAGNYATQVLIPAFAGSMAELVTVSTATGVRSVYAAKRFGIAEASTDTDLLFERDDINTLVITTQHDSHASLVVRALRAGKHVFVEKPLAISSQQLMEVELAYAESRALSTPPVLMIGFNRRFSPLVVKLKQLVDSASEPKCMVMTVNAGAIAADHWTQDLEKGGGRIVGEGCHFVDLLRYLVGSPIVLTQAVCVGRNAGLSNPEDKAMITLSFADGSIGSIHYLSNGHKSLAKERLEVFCAGRVLQLDNFRSLKGFGWPGFSSMRLWRQDKGNRACVDTFVRALEHGKEALIPFEEAVEVTRATFDAGAAFGDSR